MSTILSQELVAMLEDLFDSDKRDEWNNLMEVKLMGPIFCPVDMYLLFYIATYVHTKDTSPQTNNLLCF